MPHIPAAQVSTVPSPMCSESRAPSVKTRVSTMELMWYLKMRKMMMSSTLSMCRNVTAATMMPVRSAGFLTRRDTRAKMTNRAR